MGAVSYISLTEEVQKKIGLDTSSFGGGYIDDWGSSFLVSQEEDGRFMLHMANLGGYLHENACGGWENDSELKAIKESTFNGSVFQWGAETDDIIYHFKNNELIGIAHGGILFWTKEPVNSIDKYVEELTALESDFFYDHYGEPILRVATDEDRKTYPMKKDVKPPSTEPGPSFTFTETESLEKTKLMKGWVAELVK